MPSGPACCSGFPADLVARELNADSITSHLGRVPAITLTMALGGLAYAVVALTSNRLLIGFMLCVMSLCQAVLSVVFLPMVARNWAATGRVDHWRPSSWW